jgi:hypothetical protein
VQIPPMGMAGPLSEMKQVGCGSAILPMGAKHVTEYKDILHNHGSQACPPLPP